jgi:hypothetical protein
VANHLTKLIPGSESVVELLVTLHHRILETSRSAMERASSDELLEPRGEFSGDTLFLLDLGAQESLAEVLESASEPVLVTAEGLGEHIFPAGSGRSARFRILIDPVDGTRELSTGKRSAWVLSGVAPNRGPVTTLDDIQFAIQTELPPRHQETAAIAYAVRGGGAFEQRVRVTDGAAAGGAHRLKTSQMATLRGGFAAFADYFAGGHELTGRLADLVFESVLGPVQRGEAQVYNDQYLSTGGCVYLLASGRYRFFADLRPTLNALLERWGRDIGLCAHPYDLATLLIASESGAKVTDGSGGAAAYPFDTETDCSWIGYANDAIRDEVEQDLQEMLGSLESDLGL